MDKTDVVQMLDDVWSKGNDLSVEVRITKSALEGIEEFINTISFPPSASEWDKTGCLLVIIVHQMAYLDRMSDEMMDAIQSLTRLLKADNGEENKP